MKLEDLSEFGRAYVDALLWSSTPDGETWDIDDCAPDMIRRAFVETESFLYRFGCFIDAEPTAPGLDRAGHDFALTRNGHGAGFWDGSWPVYADMFTAGAKSFGEVDLYRGDDGLIYS